MLSGRRPVRNDERLGFVLAARPDLIEPLTSALRADLGENPQARLDALARDETASLAALQLVIVAGYYTDDRVRELNRDFFPRVEAWMERRVQSGALRPLPADLWEPVLLGPSQEFARLWLAGRTRISLRRAERELADATWNAVRAERGRRRASAISPRG